MEGVLRPALPLLADRNHPCAAACEPLCDQLLLDAAVLRGCRERQLPTYSFIEPQIIGWNHNDMHPPFGDVFAAVAKQRGVEDDLHFDPPSSLIGGEELLARIYDAIRSSSSATGSNHLNTTLLVTFASTAAPTTTSRHRRPCRQTARARRPDGLHVQSLGHTDPDAGDSAGHRADGEQGGVGATSRMRSMSERFASRSPSAPARRARAASPKSST